MAEMHLVTGYANKEHIKSADQGSFNAALLGNGDFVLDRGSKFASTIITNNIVRIKDGDIVMQGRHIRLNEELYIDLDFDNGSQGLKRNDLIVVRYEKNAETGIETAKLTVVKGNPVAVNPTDPEYIEGDILNEHALRHDMLLYRVCFDGINMQSVAPLFSVLPTWNTLKSQAIDETKETVNQIVISINNTLNEATDTVEQLVTTVDNTLSEMKEEQFQAKIVTALPSAGEENKLYIKKTSGAQENGPDYEKWLYVPKAKKASDDYYLWTGSTGPVYVFTTDRYPKVGDVVYYGTPGGSIYPTSFNQYDKVKTVNADDTITLTCQDTLTYAQTVILSLTNHKDIPVMG